MGEVKLIGAHLSLFCLRIEWALKLKGVEYDYLEEDLMNKSPLLLKYNPVHKKVPVLVHDGKPIPESLQILEYIDETWKEKYPLMPEDPYDIATARFWAGFADDKCLLGALAACWKQGEEKAKAIESVLESFAFLENQIRGKKFFGGQQMGYLDLVMGWIPHWLNVMEEVGEMKLLDAEKFPSLRTKKKKKKKFPSLNEWTQNFIQIPPVKDSYPPRDEMVDYSKGSVSFMRSSAVNKQW